MNEVCIHCDRRVPADTEEIYESHVNNCDARPLTLADIQEVKTQVAEIHEFCKNLADALKGLENNPMIRTMLGL